jgi:hypothetical protein
MVWHILVIVVGVLTAIGWICPAASSNLVFGALVVIFGALALWSFSKAKKKAA